MATHVDDERREVSVLADLSQNGNLTNSQLVFLYKLVEGVASSSFGTHVANLAGVPPEVVQRAEVVSEDFAKQFKEKIEGNKTNKAVSAMPLTVQADFAYLFSLVLGKSDLPEEKVRRREVLKGLKAAVNGYLKHSASAAA